MSDVSLNFDDVVWTLERGTPDSRELAAERVKQLFTAHTNSQAKREQQQDAVIRVPGMLSALKNVLRYGSAIAGGHAAATIALAWELYF